nr:ribonuclease H-like domain-containing protein [Tanacetum cinerariifolium]
MYTYRFSSTTSTVESATNVLIDVTTISGWNEPFVNTYALVISQHMKEILDSSCHKEPTEHDGIYGGLGITSFLREFFPDVLRFSSTTSTVESATNVLIDVTTISGYKDRLVANGQSEHQGIDCDETFSLIVKSATIHTVLSLAVSHDWPIHHLNVKNVFLHVHLSDTVYMHQPPNFVNSARPDYARYGGAKASLRREAWPPRYETDQGIGSRRDRTASGLFLSQSKFAEEILERTHMQHCNPCRTPVDTESKIGPDGDSVSDSTLFRSLRISRYVHGTLNHGLQLHVSTTTQLTEYTDADWAGCPVTRDPLLEAEYHGVANVVAETAGIRNLLLELHAPLHSVTLVYCDNVNVVYLSTNLVQHQRTKHIEIDIHFVRDYVASRQVHVLHVSSRFQYADIFTKGLLSSLFLEFRSSLNVRTPHVLIAGKY